MVSKEEGPEGLLEAEQCFGSGKPFLQACSPTSSQCCPTLPAVGDSWCGRARAKPSGPGNRGVASRGEVGRWAAVLPQRVRGGVRRREPSEQGQQLPSTLLSHHKQSVGKDCPLFIVFTPGCFQKQFKYWQT